MPVEISISDNKSKKYLDKNTKAFKNGTVLDNRYFQRSNQVQKLSATHVTKCDIKIINVFSTKLLEM